MNSILKQQLSDCAIMASNFVLTYQKEICIQIEEERFGLYYKMEVKPDAIFPDNADDFHYRIYVIFGIAYPQVMDDSDWSPSFEQALNKLKPRD